MGVILMQQPNKNYKVKISFLLHKKFSMHMALSLIFNTITAAVIFGFAAGINQPIVSINPIGFIIAMLLLTLLENFVKLLAFKYILKYMLLSFGLISYIILILLFFSVDLMLGPTFLFLGIEHLMIFTLLFALIRFSITRIYQRHLLLKKLSRR